MSQKTKIILAVIFWLAALGNGGGWALFWALVITIGLFVKTKGTKEDFANPTPATDASTTRVDWQNLTVQSDPPKAPIGKPADQQRPSHLASSPTPIVWAKKLTEICSRYSGPDYYVAEKIPQNKLKSAMKAYPVPKGGLVIALIDTTVLGTALDGFAVGEHGISWKNFSSGSLRWDEFRGLSINLAPGFFVSSIKFGETYEFRLAGTQFEGEDLLKLLLELQSALGNFSDKDFPNPPRSDAHEENGHEDVTTNPPPVTAPADCLLNINEADYKELLSLPGIGAAEAKMIGSRQASGAFFESLDDMVEFLQLKPHNAEKLKALVICEMPKSRHHHSQRDRGRVIDY